MRTESVEEEEEEEEADDENWDQCKEKISSIIESKLKINKVKIKQAHRVPRRRRSHSKDKHQTIVFKLLLYEDKENNAKSIPVERYWILHQRRL